MEIWASKGKISIYSIYVLGLPDKPKARQYPGSLPGYAGSKDFDPKVGLDVAMLKRSFLAD